MKSSSSPGAPLFADGKRSRRLTRQLLGSLLVAVMLAATSGFIPACFAVAALLSGDHQVQLGASDGHSVIRLRHDSEAAACHLHGEISRLLMVFSETQPSEPDHVLHFSGAAQYLEEREERSGINESAAVAVGATPFQFIPSTDVSASVCPHASVPLRLPTGLRTTVLLI